MLVPLRSDFDALQLGAVARKSKGTSQARDMLALAAIAARIGDVTLQIVWDWVLKFNITGPVGLIDRRTPGHLYRLGQHWKRSRRCRGGLGQCVDGLSRCK